jgi:hypothetical protein
MNTPRMVDLATAPELAGRLAAYATRRRSPVNETTLFVLEAGLAILEKLEPYSWDILDAVALSADAGIDHLNTMATDAETDFAYHPRVNPAGEAPG